MSSEFRDNPSKESKESKAAREVRKTEERHSFKIQKILLDKQSADETTRPAQSGDFKAEVTEDLRKDLSNHGQLERTGARYLGSNAKNTITESMLSSDFMSKAGEYAQEIIKKVEGDPSKLNKQEKEFFKCFFIASYYNGKGKNYQNRSRSLIRHDPKRFIEGLQAGNKELINTNIVQENLMGVTKDSSGNVTIDLAKFDPSKIDLSELDLSKLHNITIKCNDKELVSGNKSPLAPIRKAHNALKYGYQFGTYKNEPNLYREVLTYYVYLMAKDELAKKNYKKSDLDIIGNRGGNKTQDLIRQNELQKIMHDIQYDARNGDKPKKKIISKYQMTLTSSRTLWII